MIIESVHVKNFRSILDEILYCDALTALVGANGAGKSTFLKALDLFYTSNFKVELEDFYNSNTSEEISIAITFKNLPAEARALFSQYMQNDKLTVERVFAWDNGRIIPRYHGATLQNPEFQEIRDGFNLTDRGKIAKEFLTALKTKPDYKTLPNWTNKGAIQDALKKWEAEHPEKCIHQRDDGQFFGFKEVAQGYLGKFTKFLFIPAVRDASDDTLEGRNSVLTELMDLVVRSVIADKKEVLKLKEETQKQYQEILDPSKHSELKTLAVDMSKTLKTFVPNAKIDLQWQELSEIDIPMPKAYIKLVEDGYSSDVERTGHGLQRAFILTILQHLALAKTTLPNSTDNQEEEAKNNVFSNLVLAVEEPELYQHPNRQRHLAKIFLQLAHGKIPGVAETTQIIYGTHSPLFVGIDRINQIRLLRKVENVEGNPKITKITSTNLDEVAKILCKADGKSEGSYTECTILPRLKTIMTPWMNEGFFADVVVLVEGEGDRAAILGYSKALGYELEGKGFTIIPCGGKANIDRPYTIFNQLGIPVYTIWDGDCGKGETEGICQTCERPLDKKPDPNLNKRLLRLIGKEETDWPEHIEVNFACFKNDLETTLKEEIGSDLFEECLGQCQLDFSINKRKHAIKNPNVIMSIVSNAHKKGGKSQTMKEIVKKIIALKNEQ